MYFYYGMSSIGPHMSKYLFWKKYMTLVQMVGDPRESLLSKIPVLNQRD